MELRTVSFKDKKFTCGGRTFYVQDTLSFNRYRELQRISIEFGFSTTFVDMFREIQKCYDYVQTNTNWGDVAVTLYNLLVGVAKLDEKDDPALRLCALFINEKDEDTTVFDEVKIREKIDCWASELDVSPFFHLAVNLVQGWMPAYKLTSLVTLKEKETNPKVETFINS